MRFETANPHRAGRPRTAGRVFVPPSALQAGFSRLSVVQAVIAYEESRIAATVLVDRIGARGLGELLQDLDGGRTIEQAIERFGLTFPAFEADVARRLGVEGARGRR